MRHTPVAPADPAAFTAAAAEPPKKKRRSTAGKPRAAARPYRRLEDDVLAARLKELEKKLLVLRSKGVLLEDRLEGHAGEAELRRVEALA